MNETRLTVLENGKTLSYSYADLMAYHGFGYPGRRLALKRGLSHFV